MFETRLWIPNRELFVSQYSFGCLVIGIWILFVFCCLVPGIYLMLDKLHKDRIEIYISGMSHYR